MARRRNTSTAFFATCIIVGVWSSNDQTLAQTVSEISFCRGVVYGKMEVLHPGHVLRSIESDDVIGDECRIGIADLHSHGEALDKEGFERVINVTPSGVKAVNRPPLARAGSEPSDSALTKQERIYRNLRADGMLEADARKLAAGSQISPENKKPECVENAIEAGSKCQPFGALATLNAEKDRKAGDAIRDALIGGALAIGLADANRIAHMSPEEKAKYEESQERVRRLHEMSEPDNALSAAETEEIYHTFLENH